MSRSGLGSGLRMVVSPGLGVGWCSRGGGHASLGLGRIAGDVHPLLGLSEVVGLGLGAVPLILSGSIGGAVANVSGGVDVGGLFLGVAVGEGLGRTLVNLG